MLLLGADPLSKFLNRAADTPFVWGEHDCLLWLADWIRLKHGIDPAAKFRGAYKTILQAARIVHEAGGMVSLVDLAIRPVGLARVVCGARGDIAVVQVPGVGGEHFGHTAGAILLSERAALLSQGGLVVADLPQLAAWRVV